MRLRVVPHVGAVLLTVGMVHAEEKPLGFAAASRPAQAAAEARALAVPTPEKARAWLRTLTEEPHVAGTRADYQTALFVRDRLREWGWQAEISELEVLLNYPMTAPRLAIVAGAADLGPIALDEPPNVRDKDSAGPAAFPAFHGYSASGTNVTGQVVYANYGRPEDFDALTRQGVEVKGKIVLVRYFGNLFRGLKVLNAQKRGAIGILIYSDPADDGFAKGDTYPDGPYRPAGGLQRGSVQFLPLGPGDPSTPGTPSVKGAKRLPIDPANGFPLPNPDGTPSPAVAEWEKASGLKRAEYYATIPSIPISSEAARPILKGLGGATVPAGWQGGLPFTYHVGPGPVSVQMTSQQDYQVRTIWNVIATINGSVEPDRWVMVGNHRDAWVYGAVDPSSGTAATLETCRAIGEAVKAGWTPRRTLLYANWDAEEYGLVGSTEWAEQHADEVGQKAVMMLNVDSAAGGTELGLEGVPSLRDLVLQAAGAIVDPRSGQSLRDAWITRRRASWASDEPVDLDASAWSDGKNPETLAAFSPRLGSLGSGSDYTAFLDHLGVPAVDIGFGGRYGVYHSIYDDFFWMEHFGDPEFLTHTTAAKLYTLIAMRAAGADVVPLRFVPYGEALRAHVDELRRTVARKARASDHPRITFEGLPALIAAVRDFQASAARLDAATEAFAGREGVDPARLKAVNDALTRVERAFLAPEGLPNRSWFKHAIYAPGLTTGYASWPLPGIHQAVLEEDAKLLASQLPIVIRQIRAATGALDAAATLTGGGALPC